MGINDVSARGRTLDDFADEIITRLTRGGSAVLDCGFIEQVSDPDFAASGGRSATAAHIRRNAAGEDVREKSRGPKLYGPYNCLSGYNLHYRLMPHWERKERMAVAGLDPDAEILRAKDEGYAAWDTTGDWLDTVNIRPHAEFLFRLLVAEQAVRVETGETDPETAREEIANAMIEDLRDKRRGSLTGEGADRMRERLSDLFRDPELSSVMEP